jgi:hypothetical protein
MNIRTITFLLASFLFSYSFAQTNVPAVTSTHQVWNAAGSPYLVNQNSVVTTAGSVTIKPGAVVKFTGGYTLTVQGDFSAVGTSDSIIHFDSVTIIIENSSKGYDVTTDSGLHISYCEFNNSSNVPSATTYTFRSNTQILIENTTFKNCQYGLNLSGGSFRDSIVHTVDKCVFDNQLATTYGNHINAFSTSSKHVITNSTFMGSGELEVYGSAFIKKNSFDNTSGLTLTPYNSLNVECNSIKNIDVGIRLTLYRGSNLSEVVIRNNTFDSVGLDPKKGAMISFSRLNYTNVTEINNNNFLSTNGSSFKIRMTDYNQDVATSSEVNLKNNYWGTSDTTVIASFIYDYTDNIAVDGTANSSHSLSSEVTGCPGDEPSCPTPNFSFSRDDADVTVYDSTNAGSSVMRIWSFGEGTLDTTYGDSMLYSYSNSGSYYICLYTVDANGNICDSLCQQVTIPALFSCDASYYLAIDTSIAYNIFIVENSVNTTSTTKYSWDFGDGNSSNSQTPSHTYNDFGKYNLCLTISDAVSGCQSEFCDSIGMNANGDVLKTDKFTIRVVQVLNSVEELQASDLRVYPNPTRNKFGLEMDVKASDEYQFSILNKLGAAVFTSEENLLPGKQQITFDLSDYPAGIYFVKVQTAIGSVTKKVFLSK